MRTNVQRFAIRLIAAALLAGLSSPTARAQYMDPSFAGATPAGYGPSGQAMAAALPGGALDGPVWLRYTPTTDGLGYQNGYTTLGALIPMWNSSGDAIWFVEGQGHLSSEGKFFGNLGVGRRIYEPGTRRTFGISGWFDYDADRYEVFGHEFQQGGVTFDSFGDVLDFHINGYFPFREEYVLGPNSPGFFQNNIILLQGIDSALRGTDYEAGIRLPFLPIVDPRAYVGGYYFGSNSVDPFLGLSTRLEVHPTEYTTAQVRVTTDERFGTTTMFGFELHLGGRRHRPAYDRITEPVHRNDHIVRYHRDPVYAINPATGLPYRVVHVDAGAAATGLGTFELPFTTLAQAQANSIPNDVIYTYGDQTYTGGIVLKDGQQLLGTGFPLVLRNGTLTMVTAPTIAETTTQTFNDIPFLVRRFLNNSNTQNFFGDPRFTSGTGLPTGIVASSGSDVVDTTGAFRGLTDYKVITSADTFNTGDILIADFANPRPTITNPGGAAVTLANFNQVANVRITNSQFGIMGNGITGFNLNSNIISGGFNSEGIVLENIGGAGLVRNNRITGNNRPNPPSTPNVPFKDGLRMSVTGNSTAAVDVIGNLINNNDTGIHLIQNTTGTATFNMTDTITNANVNDGIRAEGLGTGTLNVSSRGTGFISDAITGRPPTVLGTPAAPGQVPPTITVNIQSSQASLNGDINKVTDNNGNGRGFFADVLDGRLNVFLNQMTFDGNDSSFFPRYGAVQFNLEPAVDSANMIVSNNSITRTGLHVNNGGATATAIDSLDSGSGIRLVSNPGAEVEHNIQILNNQINNNFSDGIKLFMLTEGIRTADLPQGTLRANVRGNTISNNEGISDDDGGVVTLTSGALATTYNQTDFQDDFDSPTAVANAAVAPLVPGTIDLAPTFGPFQGLNSNPDPKNEFTNNINGSGIVVRAKGQSSSRLFLNIQDNTLSNNAFDAINMAFAGRGNIDYVPGTAGFLTPVPVYTAIVNPDGNPGAIPFSAQSPDTFGVNAVVVIDNNTITGGPTTNTPAAGVSDDLIKATLLDGADVAMQISNNRLQSGTAASGLAVVNNAFFPAQDVGLDTAIEIDTWDTSRLMLVVDNNDIFDTGALTFTDGGIDLRSHHNSTMALRLTRNRINNIADSNSVSVGGVGGTGAGINLLAEGNSTMIAFVNNNDLFNQTVVGTYFEATSADTASLCLQLLDNNAQAGTSVQGNQRFTLAGDAFYLVQTENSLFELEPTRATNHEQQQPESQSITTYTGLLIASPGVVLPASTDVQFGNVGTGSCQARLNALFSDFPFTPDVIGFGNFDPPVVHP